MNIIFVLAVTIFIEKSCSQILSTSLNCFSDKDTLKLYCETTFLNDTIYFNLNGGNKGGCVPGLGCGSIFTQEGTTTTMTIIYNDTEHGGSWSCTFGSSTSPVVPIAKNPCKTSEDSSNIGEIVGGSVAGAVLGIGGLLAVLCKVFNGKKKKKGSDEEQNKDKKDKKKDSDEEQDKVEHLNESEPNHKNTDKKHQKDGTNDSLLNKELPSNKLPPLDLKEIKKGKEKETHEIKTK